MSSDSDDYDYEYDFKYQEPKHIELEAKCSRQVNIDLVRQARQSVPSEIKNSLRAIERREEESRIRVKDKSDRATVELVLDQRTRLILYKLVNNQTLSEIYGCVSAGKEANVYYAINNQGHEFAIKIYKTSILVFKDRQRYVEGEFRFRKGYSKHNPRKMVTMWAEKEMRNLKRMLAAGVPCPEPLLVKQNVLLMRFLGSDCEASPRLKDVRFYDRADEVYHETILLLRKIYQECRLVHADFSEYNLLYHDERVFVIDVSQAIEHDHPRALLFLRRDCGNINEYFRRQGADTLTVQGLFNFVVDPEDLPFEELWNKARGTEEMSDELFKQLHIPRTLQEVDVESKGFAGQQGLFENLTGVVQHSKSQPQLSHHNEEEGKNEDCEDSEDSEDDQDSDESDEERKPSGDVLYQGLSKQERKQKVKEDKREKRASKMPKHVKKLKIKQSAQRHRNIK